jgi:glycine C-acetyltransferase
VFELLEKDTTLRDQLEWNYFRDGMKKAGFDIIDGDSAIVPVMLYDAKLSQNMADELLKKRHICNRFFLWSLKIKQELEYNCLQSHKTTLRQGY